MQFMKALKRAATIRFPLAYETRLQSATSTAELPSVFDLRFLDSALSNRSKPVDEGRIRVTLLNQAFPTQLERLLASADTLACADGAANWLYDRQQNQQTSSQLQIPTPTFICGDFDSIRPEVKAYYGKNLVPLLQDADQDTTDAEKCVSLLAKSFLKQNDKVFLVGAIGGRFDHTIANIALLFKLAGSTPITQNDAETKHAHTQIFATGDNSFCFVIPSGRSEIMLPAMHLSDKCAILPLSGSSFVSTTGLLYNLDGNLIRMDGLISCSNTALDCKVTVKSSEPVLWFSEMP